jgi:hypothetical protein
MGKKDRSIQGKQGGAWVVLGVFVAGFFIARVGIWTGPISKDQ